jgi:hypothetical protein
MVALFVVGHLFLLLVAFHVLLQSRRYAPRAVLRYASAGRGWAADTPYCAKAGEVTSTAVIIIPRTVNFTSVFVAYPEDTE